VRALRACNRLYVRRKLIVSGELEDGWIPGYWTSGHRGSGFAPVAVTSRCGTQSSTWTKPS
jgi:hypothetical protein